MKPLKQFHLPVLAVALTFTLIAGAASAMDFCQPATGVAPVASSYYSAASLPGYYSNDYDYHLSARYNDGVGYFIPTAAGLITSPVMPLRNPVDRYYATHEVINGQVVDESDDYQAALEIPHYINPDGIDGGLAIASETYAPIDMASIGFQHFGNEAQPFNG